MPIYSMNVRAVMTAYVRADNEEEAKKAILEEFGEGNGGELPTGESDIIVSGASFTDPDFPALSISPAVTFVAQRCGDEEPEYVAADPEEESE